MTTSWDISAVASGPVASQTPSGSNIAISDTVTVSSQSLAFTQNGVTQANAIRLTVGSQTATFTQHSVAFDFRVGAQHATFVLNNVLVVQKSTTVLDSQVAAFTLNSGYAGPASQVTLASQTAAFSQNSIALSTSVSVTAGTQSFYAVPSFVTINNSTTAFLTSNTTTFSLKNVLFWDRLSPIQNGGWANIVFGEVYYGDVAAVAGFPVAAIVEAPPLRRWLPRQWYAIADQNPKNWTPIDISALIYGDDFAVAATPVAARVDAPPVSGYQTQQWSTIQGNHSPNWTPIKA
jgi:hypothetical protein